MKTYFLPLFVFFLLKGITVAGQARPEGMIAFYNLENIFDTEDDPAIWDEEFLPEGKNEWTVERYQEKIGNMATVLGKMAADIVGVCEIENRKVLEDLATHRNMLQWGYQIVHFDSPDRRGVDTGLLYRPKKFAPFESVPLRFKDESDPDFLTRDMLYVKGLYLGIDTLHIFVNHWPSRRGGKEDKRIIAAQLARQAADSILKENPDAKILFMGDFNDDPINKSIKKELRAEAKEKKLQEGDLFNAGAFIYKNGFGSLAYRGTWNLFDQIIISQPMLKSNSKTFYYKEESFTVFAPEFMRVQDGQDQGAPFRTFSRGKYIGGYSDHFPVFIYLEKK